MLVWCSSDSSIVKFVVRHIWTWIYSYSCQGIKSLLVWLASHIHWCFVSNVKTRREIDLLAIYTLLKWLIKKNSIIYSTPALCANHDELIIYSTHAPCASRNELIMYSTYAPLAVMFPYHAFLIAFKIQMDASYVREAFFKTCTTVIYKIVAGCTTLLPLTNAIFKKSCKM